VQTGKAGLFEELRISLYSCKKHVLKQIDLELSANLESYTLNLYAILVSLNEDKIYYVMIGDTYLCHKFE
jgi:hypothetical protein